MLFYPLSKFFKNTLLSAQRLTKSQDFAILKQHKKNTHSSSERVNLPVVGRKNPFGDKETAVQIRGNSHYRN
jgi:hypothetical protein